MIADKLRIRISDFVDTILYNDTQAFGFIKSDESANTNAFINKLLPCLLTIRKRRRQVIHDSIDTALEFHDDNLTERLRSYIDTIIDDVYFKENYFKDLNRSIWIRPNKNTMVKFDEIIDYETYITQQDTTTCIRNMLNEYAILPQFKREKIVFSEELELLRLSYHEDRGVGIEYNGEKLAVVVVYFVTGYTYDQNNYVFCFDLASKAIRVLLLHKIKRVYLSDEYYNIDQKISDRLRKIIDEQSFVTTELFLI
ncbi:MAG: hypothetical protein R3Y23_02750 [Bacillota bacterium]